MKTSESIAKIAAALLKAQKEMEGAKKGSANPFFKSSYADFSAVLEVCKGPLNNNGVTILQPTVNVEVNSVLADGGISTELKSHVETILLHESGEFISGVTPIKAKDLNDPQKYGAGVTYARRQGLQSLVSIPADDDDGNTASGNSKPKRDVKKPSNKMPVEKEEKKDKPKRGFTRGAKKEEPKKEEKKEEAKTDDEW